MGQTTRRRLLRWAAGTAATAGTVGTVAADGDRVDEDPYTVAAVGFTNWSPEVLVVPVGATVTWVGNPVPHTVTSADSPEAALACDHDGSDEEDTVEDSGGTVSSSDGTFDVPVDANGSVELTFEATGEFPYFCRPHCAFGMVGTVRVVDA